MKPCATDGEKIREAVRDVRLYDIYLDAYNKQSSASQHDGAKRGAPSKHKAGLRAVFEYARSTASETAMPDVCPTCGTTDGYVPAGSTPSATRSTGQPIDEFEKHLRGEPSALDRPSDKHSTPKAVALRCAEIVREYARRDDIDHDSVPGVTITAIQDFAATLSDTASATRRVLFSTDSHCPACGHNRDKSSVSSINNEDGTHYCQMCSTEWEER